MSKRFGIAIFLTATIIFLLGTYFEISHKKYKVQFIGIDNPYTLTIAENTYIKKVDDPIKEGYEFIGWYYNNIKFNFNEKITKNMKLEARWILK